MELAYVAGVDGTVLDLESDDVFFGSAVGLRAREWSYSISSRALSGVTRKSREVDVDVSFGSRDAFDAAEDVFDADVLAGSPGEIHAASADGGVWRQRAYVTGMEYASKGLGSKGTAKVVLLDGVWVRDLEMVTFSPSTADGSEWLDYPHDFPADYMGSSASQRLVNPVRTPASWTMHVYGPASNPYVMVGGNVHRVNCSVPSGGYLTVDASTGSKRAYVTDQQGNVTNVFADAERGDGAGSGKYIFERIQPGVNTVTWDGSFTFDVTMHVERSSPSWQSL